MRTFCHERFAECWASREILATARCFSVKRLAIRWGWHYLCFTITKRLYEKTKQKKMCNRAVCHKSQSAAWLSELIIYFTSCALILGVRLLTILTHLWSETKIVILTHPTKTQRKWTHRKRMKRPAWCSPCNTVSNAIKPWATDPNAKKFNANSTLWNGAPRTREHLKDAESVGLSGEWLHFQYSKSLRTNYFPIFSYDRFVLRFSQNEAVSVSWRLTASLSLSDFKILRISP